MIQWGRNWHAPELIRWMANDATIELSDKGRLQCKAISFRNRRKLIAYLNGEPILNDVVPTALTRIEFSVQPGILRLHCPDGGERPCDFPELQNNDTRLLSIAFGEWEYVEPVASFDYQAYPRRLNLGCGRDKRTGYLNVDFKASSEPDLIAGRVRELLKSANK